jgi:hypothetical protein
LIYRYRQLQMTSRYITLDESFSINSETCRYSDDEILADYTCVAHWEWTIQAVLVVQYGVIHGFPSHAVLLCLGHSFHLTA